MDAHLRRVAVDAPQPRATTGAAARRDRKLGLGGAVGLAPLVLALARQAADVLALAATVVPLDLLARDRRVVVPLLVLGDAEVDERAIPDVAEAHVRRDRNPCAGRRRLAHEGRADADQRRPLRDRDLPVLEVPIESSSRPCAAASAARRANHGRDASGSSASGGIVISPRIDG